MDDQEQAAELERLREALTWATDFIRCNSPRTCDDYPDYHNARALVDADPLRNGPLQMASIRAELAEAELDRLRPQVRRDAGRFRYFMEVARDSGWPNTVVKCEGYALEAEATLGIPPVEPKP